MWPKKNLDSTPCCSPGASTIVTTAVCLKAHANENFKVIQNPGFLPDHPQNWISYSLCHSRHTLKISERSVHNFLSYLADSQTDKQTVWQKHYLLGGGNQPISCFGSVMAGCWTWDRELVGSTLGGDAIKWMSDCLRTGKPYRYITNRQKSTQSSIPPGQVNRVPTVLCGGCGGGTSSPVSGGSLVGDIAWSHMAGDAP